MHSSVLMCTCITTEAIKTMFYIQLSNIPKHIWCNKVYQVYCIIHRQSLVFKYDFTIKHFDASLIKEIL